MKPMYPGRSFFRTLAILLIASAVCLHGWLSSAAGWSGIFLPLIGKGWPTPTPPYSPLLITEVLPDPFGEQPAGEWIELYNRSGTRIDLTDVKVGDEETEGGGEGMWGFPEENAIQAGQVIVVANQATAFFDTYGFLPDYEFANTHPAVRDMWKYSNWGGGKVNLTSDGDEVLLLDPHNQLMDAVSWGNSTFAFNPSIRRPEKGQSLERKPADLDRNSANDWRVQANPRPGKVDLQPPTPTATPSPTASATWTLTPTMTQAACGQANLLVSEVMYDPVEATDPQGEWLELYNPSGQSVNLACLKVGDEETPGGGEGMLLFPRGAALPPGGVVVIAYQAVDFAVRYGFNPDYEVSQTDPNVPDMLRYPNWANGSMNLSNTGDELLILDGDDQLLDTLSWGSSNFAFSPPVPTVAPGHSLERRPANRDTDTSSDWVDQSSPNPGYIELPGETPTPTITSSRMPCGATKLLVSEVFYDPSLTSDPDGEWLELFNPNPQAVNLGCFKVGDEETPGGGEAMLAFPPSAMLEPGGVAVIAYRGTTFSGMYGFLPSFEAVDSSPAIPDMLRYSSWATGSLNLSNSGDEVLILDTYDQLVDAISWGSSTFAFNPPIGTVVSGHSLERRPADRDTDRASDWMDQGNPRPGEVDLSPAPHSPTATPTRTRTPSRSATPTRTPTPRRSSTPTLTRTSELFGLIINEVHADPDVSYGDANNDGRVDSVEDEFIELVNSSGHVLDLSGWMIFDAIGEHHTFPAGTTLANGCSIVVFGGGTPTGTFGGSLVQIASSGTLSLNDRGEIVIVRDATGFEMVTVSYGLEGDDNQSLTRDPDLTGPEPLVKHTLANGAAGARFSPGTKIDGTFFSSVCALR